MNTQSIIIGLACFIIIGVFHPIVIQAEYHFGKKIWPLFLLSGISLLAVSLWISYIVLSSIVSITGFTCLWSIKELQDQEKRVQKGWFPVNPKRNPHSQKLPEE